MKTKSKGKKSKRDEYHHGDLRRVLIESAIQILNNEGYERLSLRLCARKANVSASAPAHHFKNINQLLTAVAVYGFNSLKDQLQQTLDMPANREKDRIKTISLAYLKFAIRNDALYRVMFTPTLDRNDPDFIQAHLLCFSILKREVSQKNPDETKAEIEVMAFRIWSLAHGFVVLLLGDRLQMVFPEAKIPQTDKELSEAFLKYLF